MHPQFMALTGVQNNVIQIDIIVTQLWPPQLLPPPQVVVYFTVGASEFIKVYISGAQRASDEC